MEKPKARICKGLGKDVFYFEVLETWWLFQRWIPIRYGTKSSKEKLIEVGSDFEIIEQNEPIRVVGLGAYDKENRWHLKRKNHA